ncbi:hypothetical protein BDB00DRAFT_736407, partial [Zychaea mexicana]|uniref:uncharacterized protein n=1 Tax=Zychaea mexicana TaxID=64656 RepID=UPI0022FF1ACF
AQCSYDGSATQVDLFNLVKLNETVDMLQQRVHSIETDLKDVSTNTQFVADEFRMTRSSAERASQSAVVGSSDSNSNYNNNFAAMNSLFASSSNSNGQWSLSLTPRGLRIDTNIISLHDLYNILLTGVSQSDASSTSSGASTSVPELDRTTIARKKNLWKTKLKTFPLYSTWEPHRADAPNDHAQNNNSNNENAPEMMSQETCDELMDIYDECLLCLPCADLDDSVADRYKKGTLDPLLQYAALAWTARHAAIYHDLFPGRDPNLVGEQFFDKAKELLKERFTTTDIDTMHGLIIMYVYAIGRPDERRNSMQSEAYIYLGLAIRMCLNMKMFQESTSPDPIMREKHRRFFWALYFLETLCTVHSDKAFSLPPEDLITVSFPTVLPHEVGGEKQWRVLFTSQRFRITRIYRNIIYKTAHEKPLLSSISTLDKDLDDWLDQLVPEFKYTAGDINRRDWASSSFREQGCIKLNSEYNFQLCQLYSLFASKSEQRQPSAIDLLTNERCKVAADNIVDLLECFSRLKQRWCHFSLETTMIATMVYGSMLSSPNSEWPRQQLQRMLTILSNSPVQHHKYVFALTKRIEKMLAE